MIHHITRIHLEQGGVTLFVFADRQQGGEGYSKEAWQEFKHEFQTTKNAWAIGLGDYGDWLRPSLRPQLTNSMSKDDSARQAFDSAILKQHDEIINDMEFLKSKLLGIHAGHHFWEFANGINTDQRLASALKAPYLGWIASTRIALTYGNKRNNARDRAHVYTMISTHGNANGRRVPAALAYLENNYANSFIADQYLMGHGCKNANDVPFKRNIVRRVGPAGMDVQIPRLLVVGGFSEGYTDGWKSSYVQQAGFTPQPMGYGLIRFSRTSGNSLRIARGLMNKNTTILKIEQLNRVLEM